MARSYASAAANNGPAPDYGRMDDVAVKALARAFKAWRVNIPDAAALVGVSERTWSRMKNDDWSGTLSHDQRLRASGLIGLYKGLHLYFNDTLADRWVKMRNRGPLFLGATPLEYMVEGGLPAILRAREYVDAVRGGV